MAGNYRPSIWTQVYLTPKPIGSGYAMIGLKLKLEDGRYD